MKKPLVNSIQQVNAKRNLTPVRKTLNRLATFMALLGMAPVVHAQISEGFETGLPPAFTSTTSFTLASGTWTAQENGIVVGTTGVKTGSHSLQLRSQTGAQITSPVLTGGVGTVRFWASINAGSGSSLQVNYSTDGGLTWLQATGSPFALNTTVTEYTATINAPNANRIQFYRTNATVYVDDVVTTGYAAGYYWNGASISANPAAGGAGNWTAASAWRQPDASGAQATWANGNPAYLGATGGIVTLSGNVSPSHTSITSTGYTIATSANATLAGTITLGTNSLTTAPAAGQTLRLPGSISGSGGITQNGAGTTTLSGTNTYTGATNISAGTLNITGSTASASAVTVASPATLAGSGTAGGMVTLSGTVSPGSGAGVSGTLTTGAILFNGGSTYRFDISNVSGAAGDASGWDKLTATGNISIASTTVSAAVINVVAPATGSGFNAATSYSWVIASGTSIAGFAPNKFSVNTSGFGPAFSGTFSVSQSGNDMLLVYSPAAAITYPNNAFRSKTAGTWTSVSGAGTATWERYSTATSSWADVAGVSPTGSAVVYIAHNITIPTNGGSMGSPNISIQTGASLTWQSSSPWTAGGMYLYSGSLLQINTRFTIATGAVFEVEDNATVNFKYSSYDGTNLNSSLWQGTENFHPLSNFVIQSQTSGTGNYFIPSEAAVTANTYNGFTACFGNLIFDSDGSATYDFFGSAFTKNLTHNDFVIKSQIPTTNALRLSAFKLTTTIGGNFTMETGSQRPVSFSNTSGNLLDITVNGDITNNSNKTLNINGAAAGNTVNLKGDLTIAATALLTAAQATNFNFTGTGDGSTPALTQTIDIASAGQARNQNINFNVNQGAYVQLINRNLELGANSSFTVKGGGTLDFNFNSSNTALNITSNGSGTFFTSQQASTLKISSPAGISRTSGTQGNVQVSNAPTYHQTATFWYIGKASQVTGTGLTTGSTGKIVICDLAGNDLTLTPTNDIGISNNTALDALGGRLEIRKGTVVGTNAADFTGSGRLVMTDGEYQVATILSTVSNTLPQLSGYNNYSLTGGTITLNGSNAIQTLSGVPSYYNLKFAGSNTPGNVATSPFAADYKTISSGAQVAGNITVESGAILFTSNYSLGGTSTSFTINGNGRYITGGGGTKPDAGRTYTLSPESTIEFVDAATKNIRLSAANGNPVYGNIIIRGSSVTTSSAISGINFQAGGSFTVKDGGVFKVATTAGFSGGLNTAVVALNAPAITLDNNSTIEYTGAPAQTFTARTDYKNVTINGGGTKTVAGPATISGKLTLTNGILTTTSANLVTLVSGATIAGGNTNSFVSGPLRRFINNAEPLLFPLGNPGAASAYKPLNFTPDAGTTGTAAYFTGEFFVNAPPAGPMGTALQGVLKNEYWQLERVNTSSVAGTVTLNYTQPAAGSWWNTDNNTAAPDPCTACTVQIIKRASDDNGLLRRSWSFTYENAPPATGGPYSTPASGNGSISTTLVSNFSYFGFGYSGGAVLPVKLLYFTGELWGKDAGLKWKVDLLKDLKGFELEYSQTGNNFHKLAEVAPSLSQEYTYWHLAVPAGANYYRLKVLDKNGSSFYSRVVLLTTGASATHIVGLKQNPARESITPLIQSPIVQAVKARLTDASGRLLGSWQTSLQPGNNHWNIKTGNMAAGGIYFITIETEDGTRKTLKLIKE